MKTVLIFGGSGFVAKHIIRQLAKNGYKIVVLYQQPTNEVFRFIILLASFISLLINSLSIDLY